MKPHFLKEDALIALKANVQANLVNYSKATNEWIYDYFQSEDPFLEANFECEDFQLLISPKYDEISYTDVQNVRILYSALKNLTDTQATDERLWAGLTHYDLWDYMSKRWKMEESKMTPQLVLSRYFISNTNGRKRGLTVNTLSKLWWIGRLTYDQHRSDPFELLKYFETDFSTKLLMMFSNNFMSNFEISTGLIEALVYLDSIGYALNDTEKTKSSGPKDVYLKATGYLNVFGGTHILDYFSKDEIKKRLIDYMLSLPHIQKEGYAAKPLKQVNNNTDRETLHFPSIQAALRTASNSTSVSSSPRDNSIDSAEKNTVEPQLLAAERKLLRNREQTVLSPHDEVSPKSINHESSLGILHSAEMNSSRINTTLTRQDKEIIAYCNDMRRSYSYKAVLLLALLEKAASDGKMIIEQAVPFFREFYRTRVEKGLPAELKSSIFSDLDVDDARILANIIRNPLNALLLSNYFEYDGNTRRFGFKNDVWINITAFGREMMKEATTARLNKYYQDP